MSERERKEKEWEREWKRERYVNMQIIRKGSEREWVRRGNVYLKKGIKIWGRRVATTNALHNSKLNITAYFCFADSFHEKKKY